MKLCSVYTTGEDVMRRFDRSGITTATAGGTGCFPENGVHKNRRRVRPTAQDNNTTAQHHGQCGQILQHR